MPIKKLVDRVPQTIDEADSELREMQRLEREMAERRAARDAELHPLLEMRNSAQSQIDTINASAEADLAELEREYEQRDARMRAFAQSHRTMLESIAKAKLFRFVCGGLVRWRRNPKRLKVSGKLADIAEALRQAGRSDLFEVKYKLKIGEIKKNPELVKTIDGLDIVQDEVLIVNPKG